MMEDVLVEHTLSHKMDDSQNIKKKLASALLLLIKVLMWIFRKNKPKKTICILIIEHNNEVASLFIFCKSSAHFNLLV
jgi:hypothetical protein